MLDYRPAVYQSLCFLLDYYHVAMWLGACTSNNRVTTMDALPGKR